MQFYKINIENFRSIKELSIELKPVDGSATFTIFGINETGKSNILKAIALLSNSSVFTYAKDCEKTAYRESKNVVIESCFKVNDSKFLAGSLEKSGLPQELLKSLRITEVKKTITFSSDGEREEVFWLSFEGVDYKKFAYVQVENKPKTIFLKGEKVEGTIKDLTALTLDLYLYLILTPDLDLIFPKVLFWTASSKYLITDPVNLTAFKSSLDVSVPLRNVFALAGFLSQADVQKAIEMGEQSIEERQYLEETLSMAATYHVNKLWPEHKINIKVRIESNNECTVFVEDKDNSKQRYSMEQRSDGFKHFISILLTLSAENKTEQLKNVIVLLDEPENSLHPSSIRYLRDELLSIGRLNTVIAASHSIFMVDKKNINRHLTATKTGSNTHLARVDPENPLSEEIVYEALGTSVYEVLEPNLLVFEGRTDKDLFDYFATKFKSKLKLPAIKTISATGVEQIPKYVKFFSGKLVKGFISVDSDAAGRDCVKNVITDLPSMKSRCFHLKALVDSLPDNSTLEDMFPHDITVAVAQKLYDAIFQVTADLPIIDQIKKIKSSKGIHSDHKLETYKRDVMSRIIDEGKKMKFDDFTARFPKFALYLQNLSTSIKESK